MASRPRLRFLLGLIVAALVPAIAERPPHGNEKHHGGIRGVEQAVPHKVKHRDLAVIAAKAHGQTGTANAATVQGKTGTANAAKVNRKTGKSDAAKSHGKAANAQLEMLELKGGHKLEQAPTTTTEHESWFDRMGDAIVEFFVGILLILFSIPVMWFNERRSARMEALVAVGESECVSVVKASPENRGALVHVNNNDARAMKPLASPWFEEVAFDTDCIRLRSTVEVYQWIEHKQEKERKDLVGGGSTKTTTYTYTKEWSSTRNDSSGYRNPNKQNKFPISPGVHTQNSSRVELGEDEGGFVVPDDMVSQLTNFVSAHSKLGDTVTSKAGGALSFAKGDRFYSYGSGDKIGDVRVKFEMINDGPVTVLALQAESKGDRDTFLPYRVIPRGCCCFGVDEEERRVRLLNEAQKTPDELSEEDRCSCGPLNLCCCFCIGICNLVNMCFSQLLTPQIYHMFAGQRKVAACFSNIKYQSKVMTWILRVVGWLMLFVGTYSLFSPLLVMIDIVPFLGPFVSTMGSYAIWGICLLATLLLATLVISMAYLVYRPLVGMLYLVIAGAVAGIIFAISNGSIAVPA